MTLKPGNALAVHQPLGSVMRARLQVHRLLSEFRHRENGVTEHPPTGIDVIPA